MRRLVFVPVVLTACSEPGLKAFNASPEVLIAAPAGGDTVSAGVEVTLRGVVSDPDGPLDGLEASWLVDDVQVCAPEPPDAEGLVACETVLAPGLRVITFQARDAGGAAGADSVSVTAASDAAGATLEVVVTPTDGTGFGPTGETVTVPMTGAVLSTVAVAVPVSVPPSPSSAVAVHVMLSPGLSVDVML